MCEEVMCDKTFTKYVKQTINMKLIYKNRDTRIRYKNV